MTDTVSTERLELVPMTPRFLRYTSLGMREEAEEILGRKIPPAWFQYVEFAELRLKQTESGVIQPPWQPRAIILRRTREMVGCIGFHTPPGPDYLTRLSPGGVEFGYTIFPEFRRNRYAWEATYGLLRWARLDHGVKSFVASVSPTNAASLDLISKMGFRRIGRQIDEQNRPEEIFELVLDK